MIAFRFVWFFWLPLGEGMIIKGSNLMQIPEKYSQCTMYAFIQFRLSKSLESNLHKYGNSIQSI